MKTSYLYILLSILLISCGKKSEQTSQLRIGQFMFDSENVEIKLKKNNEEEYSENIKYGKLTEYKEFDSGTYEIEVLNDGKRILQKKFGLGNGGLFTLVIYGIPQQEQVVNYQSTKAKLLEVVKGTEARSANSFMPQISILNDKFEIGKQEAKVRWLHLAPGVNSLNAKTIKNSDETDLGSIEYPATSEKKVLKPGTYELGWFLEDKKVEVAHEELKISASTLYTIFVLGSENSFINDLKIVVGETPKKKF